MHAHHLRQPADHEQDGECSHEPAESDLLRRGRVVVRLGAALAARALGDAAHGRGPSAPGSRDGVQGADHGQVTVYQHSTQQST